VLNVSASLEHLEGKLAGLQSERDTLAASRTREDVRALVESWLSAACARHNGMAGLVLNGHANPAEVQAVISEFLLDSPALFDFIVKKVEATTELTNRQRDSSYGHCEERFARRGEGGRFVPRLPGEQEGSSFNCLRRERSSRSWSQGGRREAGGR
jgi:hypothetical protein